MKRLLRIVLFNLLIVTVLLFVIEFICSVIVNRIYNHDFDANIIEQKKYGDSDGLKPNASGIVWGKSFHTDENGGRTTGKPFDKKKKTHLYIGDSVTEGVGVEDNQAFVSVLAHECDTINFFNISLAGWSTHDYLNVVRAHLTSLNPHITNITICYCLNDHYGQQNTSELPSVGQQGFITSLSTFLQEHYSTYRLLKVAVKRNANNYLVYDSTLYATHPEMLRKAAEDLRACKELCDSMQVHLDVAVLPYRSQRSNDLAQTEPQKTIAKALRKAVGESNVRIISFQPGELVNNNALYLFADEIHFSPFGHRLIANQLQKP